MSKNVLVISTSPRQNGNSETLATTFAQGAQDAGHSVEVIRLHDKKIGFCMAVLPVKKQNTVSFTMMPT